MTKTFMNIPRKSMEAGHDLHVPDPGFSLQLDNLWTSFTFSIASPTSLKQRQARNSESVDVWGEGGCYNDGNINLDQLEQQITKRSDFTVLEVRRRRKL